MDQEILTKVRFGAHSIRGNLDSLTYRIVAVGVAKDDYKDAKFLLNLPDPPFRNTVHKYIEQNMSETASFDAQAKVTNRSNRSDTDYIGHIRKIVFDTRTLLEPKRIFSRKRKWCQERGIDCFQRENKFYWDDGKYPGYYAAMTALELVMDDPSLIRKGERYP